MPKKGLFGDSVVYIKKPDGEWQNVGVACRCVSINGKEYISVKEPRSRCKDCDIFKDSRIRAPHQYPLCYTHTMSGKEADYGTRGLIVNYCARHQSWIWKKRNK